MNDQLRQDLERSTTRWLAEGPDRAPSGLLARTLGQTSLTRQRAAWLATVAGTPTLGGTWRSSSPLRLWLVAALIVLGAVAIVVLAGLRNNETVVVTPTDQASVRPTPVATQAAATTAPATQAPQPRALVDAEHAYWLSPSGDYQRIGDTFGTGCILGGDFCPAGVRVVVADPAAGLSVPVGEAAPVLIRGSSIDRLRASWVDAFPGDAITSAVVDGQPAFETTAGNQKGWVVTLFEGRIYGFEAYSIAGFVSVPGPFLAAFHFFAPACWMEPCPSEAPAGAEDEAILRFDAKQADWTWTEVPPGFDVTVGFDRSMRRFAVHCEYCIAGGTLVSVGRFGDGVAVSVPASFGSEGPIAQQRIFGHDLASLEDNYQTWFGAATFQPTEIDGITGSYVSNGMFATALFVRRDQLIAITTWGLYAFDRSPVRMLHMFEDALTFRG